uniref:hypothetical protein n=1 Tax=Nonomuraea sp. CA-251285 TaxID=3240002 RepID=UPI003F493587
MATLNPPIWLQAGTYPARYDRLAVATLNTPAPAVGALAARAGVRPGGLTVTQRATPAMFVTVAAGSAIVQSSSATGGAYICHNDASVDVAIATAHATLGRRDLIIARVYDAEVSGSANEWRVESVTGTPAGSPTVPATPSGAIALASVQVNAAATTITNANITDVRAYASTLGGIPPATSGAMPASPYEGQGAYQTDLDKPVWWNGSAWRSWTDEGYQTQAAVASYLSAQGYLTQGAVDAWDWTSFTTTWSAATTNPTLGNGTLACAYRTIGKTAFIRMKLVMGSTTNKGSGLYGFTLPAAITPAETQAMAGFISNSSGTVRHVIAGFLTPGSGVFRIALGDGSSGVSNTAPIAWATGDQLILTGAIHIS